MIAETLVPRLRALFQIIIPIVGRVVYRMKPLESYVALKSAGTSVAFSLEY
jgi:hypothetical protein